MLSIFQEYAEQMTLETRALLQLALEEASLQQQELQPNEMALQLDDSRLTDNPFRAEYLLLGALRLDPSLVLPARYVSASQMDRYRMGCNIQILGNKEDYPGGSGLETLVRDVIGRAVERASESGRLVRPADVIHMMLTYSDGLKRCGSFLLDLKPPNSTLADVDMGKWMEKNLDSFVEGRIAEWVRRTKERMELRLGEYGIQKESRTELKDADKNIQEALRRAQEVAHSMHHLRVEDEHMLVAMTELDTDGFFFVNGLTPGHARNILENSCPARERGECYSSPLMIPLEVTLADFIGRMPPPDARLHPNRDSYFLLQRIFTDRAQREEFAQCMEELRMNSDNLANRARHMAQSTVPELRVLRAPRANTPPMEQLSVLLADFNNSVQWASEFRSRIKAAPDGIVVLLQSEPQRLALLKAMNGILQRNPSLGINLAPGKELRPSKQGSWLVEQLGNFQKEIIAPCPPPETDIAAQTALLCRMIGKYMYFNPGAQLRLGGK